MPKSPDEDRHTARLRAACDECRFKKLKCGGERPLCARCRQEGLTCVYSPQGPMGRPKKRQRTTSAEPPVVNESADRRKSGAYGFSTNHDLTENGTTGLVTGFYQEPFTPGGSVQPWLTEDWSAASTDAGVVSPTPDSTSHSETATVVPLDLPINNNSGTGYTSPATLADPNFIEPTNVTLPKAPIPACACLSTLYLTLSAISTMDESFLFPFALHPLREAMQTASNLLTCPVCPTTFITGLQNVGLLGTLLISIAERFSKILDSINAESERATAVTETKKFRLADLNNSTSHLHTGGLGCAASFSLDLSPEEWRKMAKKVVRAEVYGPADGNACCPYFMQLTSQMEDRQNRWHKLPLPKDVPKGGKTSTIYRTGKTKDGEHQCLKNVAFAKQLVDGFDWS